MNDKIDIDNESDLVKQQRILNGVKTNMSETPKKEKRGFCTQCAIF